MFHTKSGFAKPAFIILLMLQTSSCEKKDGSPEPAPVPPPQFEQRPVSSAPLVTLSEKYTLDQLMSCIGVADPKPNCTLSTIEQDVREITVDEIMARTLVESPWMGQRFRELLESIPAPFLRLAGCSKGVVIARDTPTSSLRNGGIQIWSGGLAISEDEIQESKTTSASSAEQELPPFGLLALHYQAEENSRSKELFDPKSYRRLKMASIVIHEWSHSCDLLAKDRDQQLLSTRLLPPESKNLEKFAGLVYGGRTELKAEIETLDPMSLAQEFANDRAPTLYAYANVLENFAEIISTYYLRTVYGIGRVHAMVDLKSGKVLWSQRDHECGAKVAETTRKALELLGRGMESQVELVKTCEPVEDANDITWKELVEKFQKNPA